MSQAVAPVTEKYQFITSGPALPLAFFLCLHQDFYRLAQQAGIEAVVDGVAASAVDMACRQILEEAGLGDAFIHGTGHGVGLDIHEAPALSGTSTATLRCGQVVTVEPGAYITGLGGVRWEDTVVVGSGGCQRLTRSPSTT